MERTCSDPECYYHEPVMGHCAYCGAALCEGCLCVHEVGGICPAQGVEGTDVPESAPCVR